MAKVKTPKVKDLRPEKITKEQLTSMQSLVSKITKVTFDLGTIQARNHELLHVYGEINSKIQGLQEELEKQYGTVDIDIKDGTIKYKDESHNS